MKKVSRNFLLLLLTIFMVMTPIVLGANILDNVLKPFSGIDIGDTYLNKGYAPFIDAIIYFILFIGVASAGLGQTFKDNKSISIIVGVMLAVGMCVFELQTGFNIGKFAPVAALIFFLVIGIFIYNLIKNLTDQTFAAVSLAFLIIYGMAQAMAPTLIEWVGEVPWLNTTVALMLVASIIGLVYGIISLFKGIKSGSWGANHESVKEKRSEDEFKAREKDEEKMLKKEKNAAEKMMKLETELSGIESNIAELEKIEANIATRDHKTREEQIATLAELENALNGSWRLQKQLQDAYSNASKPEYSSNQAYMDNIKTAAKQLDEFINKIRFHLTTLLTAIEQSKSLYENDTLKLEQELTNKTTALQTIANRAIDITNELKSLSIKMAGRGIINNSTEIQNITDALKTNIEAKSLINNIINANVAISGAQRSIHEIDSKNIAELKKAISVTEINPAKDIGLLRNGLNIGMNTSNIKSELSQANGAFNKIATILNMGYKYLSGDSLRQMYESVKTVHMNTAKILNELMAIENSNKQERTKDIANCINLMNVDNNTIATSITKLILTSNTNIQKDINEITALKDGLKGLIAKYQADIENIKKGGLTKQALITYLTNSIIQLADEKTNKVDVLTNKNVRDLLTNKIYSITKILSEIQVEIKKSITNFKTNDAVRDKYVKDLDQIALDLENNINKEMNEYVIIQANLKTDSDLTKLSTELDKTKVPTFPTT